MHRTIATQLEPVLDFFPTYYFVALAVQLQELTRGVVK